jgi:hypothetical protein
VILVKKIAIGLGAWVVVLTTAHFTMNVNWGVLLNDRLPESRRKLNVAYIPVT